MYLHHKVFWALVTWDLAALGRGGGPGTHSQERPLGLYLALPSVTTQVASDVKRGMAFLCQNSELLS